MNHCKGDNCSNNDEDNYTGASDVVGVVVPDDFRDEDVDENTSLTAPFPGPRVLRSPAAALPEVTTAVRAAIRSFLC